ncbi:MAG: PstS family phosphate ABC transporter substrate-binding protein [Pirellulaceae bacterium]|nr:PstS family phosphate ABC transporter substrate-binding protein [Pirellulaceae bacterium]
MATCNESGRYGLWVLLLGVWILVGCTTSNSLPDVEELSALDEALTEENQEGAVGGIADLSGEVKIDGSSTVYPISEAVADEFLQKFPKVNVTVAVSGTGGGFKRFSQGETDISDASRPIKQKELDACRESGVQFIELPVAYDGLTIVVNPANDWAEQLTVDDLKKIFGGEGTAQNWSDVNPSWPNETIKIYAPGADSGTFDYFKEVVAGKKGSLRNDMSVSEDDNVLVTGVAGEKNAIGFFGAAYYFENEGKLKAVKIVNPKSGDAVLPSPNTIESGVYAPFSRPLFIYVNVESTKRPEIKKFIDFYLQDAFRLAQAVGYVALPGEVYDLAKKHVDERLAGTHYLVSDGEKRSGAVTEVYLVDNLLE